MGYKSYIFRILIRIILIFLIGFLGIYILYFTGLWLVGIWVVLAVLVLIAEFFRYVLRYHNELIQFLTNLSAGEFNLLVKDESEIKNNLPLKKAFLRLEKSVKKISMQKERNLILLETVLNTVKSAIVCYDDEGKTLFVNNEAKVLFATFSTHNIDKLLQMFDHEFANELKQLKFGIKTTKKLIVNNEIQFLLIESYKFKLEGTGYKVLAFSDIKREMAEQEMESFQKLTRVINHEIMNSAIPISNLTSLVLQTLSAENIGSFSDLNIEDEEDVRLSLKVIDSRTKGLIHFIKAVKQFNSISKPLFKKAELNSVINNVCVLLKDDADRLNIKMNYNKTEPVELLFDEKLIEQVFVNIIKNAIEALHDITDPVINITIEKDTENCYVIISDNGHGIDEKNVNEIFVPFFTTKKEGSGIGLSICRQIMQLHKGDVTIRSEKGKETSVIVKF